MKNTIEALHLAAQYLAVAGINFVEKQSDDSHTNLGWDIDKQQLSTHYFGKENNQVAFLVASGTLEWLENNKVCATWDLKTATHAENILWMQKQSAKRDLGNYTYAYHYDLPYAEIEDDSIFSFNFEEVRIISNRWDIGQSAFENFLNSTDLSSPIRIWPHHFDLGIYTQLDTDGELFLGAGLAVPDTLVDDLYYYASGWENGLAVKTESFKGLSSGNWRSDWNGATLASENIDEAVVLRFLEETRLKFLEDA